MSLLMGNSMISVAPTRSSSGIRRLTFARHDRHDGIQMGLSQRGNGRGTQSGQQFQNLLQIFLGYIQDQQNSSPRLYCASKEHQKVSHFLRPFMPTFLVGDEQEFAGKGFDVDLFDNGSLPHLLRHIVKGNEGSIEFSLRNHRPKVSGFAENSVGNPWVVNDCVMRCQPVDSQVSSVHQRQNFRLHDTHW